MQLELAIEAAWPADTDWQSLAEACWAATAPFAPPLPAHAEVSLVLADDATIRHLNAQWRGKDQPTNVLSFPMSEPDGLAELSTDPSPEILIGDIILALETCSAEAAAKGISLQTHAAHLIIHGMFHLLGHDHQDEVSANAMEALEVKALANMAIGNPYADDQLGENENHA